MGRGTMAGGGDPDEGRTRQEGAPGRREATTLSTIAVQSGTTRIVIALLQNKEWVELKCVEMTPELSHLAPTLDEAQQLQQQHDDVLQKLASKESPVEDLLNQADQLIAKQDNKASTYSAMAESLAMAWRELNEQLEQRRQVLSQCVKYHRRSQNFSDILDLADGVFGDVTIPSEPAAAEEAIRRLVDVRKGVLEASMLTLQEGNVLLEKLRLLATRGTIDSRPNQIRTAVQAACVEVERWMEAMHDRRRLVDVLFSNRRHILEQCLALAMFHADLDVVQRRAEKAHADLVSACELGDSASSAEILLYEHSKLVSEAKVVQDRGLQLLRAAESLVQGGTFARDQPRTRAYSVLEVCSQLVGGAERRRTLLTAAAEFFRLAQQASDRLLQLEGDLQATAAADQGATLSRVSSALEEAAEPALRSGQNILDETGPSQPGTEGISRRMGELRRRLAALSSRCQAFQETHTLRTQSYREFVDEYRRLLGWLEDVDESFLRTHTSLGDSSESAGQFVTLHERLLEDIMAKGGEIDKLLYNLGDIVRHLDRSQAKQLEQKGGDLRGRWNTLQHVVESRLDLAKLYLRFHQQTTAVQTSLDDLNMLLTGPALSDEHMRQLEDQWLTMQQKYHQLAALGQRFIDKSHQVRDRYLETAAARSCVEAILEQLKAGHLTITENYERVQLTTTTIKRVQRQWDRVQRDVRKVEESVTSLESELYPILREKGLSVEQRSRQCENRMDSVLPMLRQAQADVEQMALTAEKLSDKGAGETSRAAEKMAQELNAKKNSLVKSVSDYQNLLQMVMSYLRKLKDVESSVQKRRQLDVSRPLPRENDECQQALKDHEKTQRGFNELFRMAGEELERLAERLRQVEPPAAAEHDISQLREALDREATKWNEAQTARKELLEKQVASTVFDSELHAINSQLTELSDQLTSARGQYGDSLQQAKQTKEAFRAFEDTIEGTGRQIENFVSTAQEYLGSTPERETAVVQLESLQDRWTAFQRQVADNRRLTDFAIDYYKLLEKAEDWYKSGGRLLVDVARKVSQVRCPEEADQLRTDITQFLTPGAQEQSQRLETAAGMAHQLFGGAPPRRLVSVTQDGQEMVESFEAILQHLNTLGGSLELMRRERDSLKKEKDQLSAEREAARQEAEVARSATAAADEARRAAEAAAHVLNETRQPIAPLAVSKTDVCTETITEMIKATVDRSTQEQLVSAVEAATQNAPPRQEQVTRESIVTQQVSPPKRHRRDEPPQVAPEFTEPLTDQTVQDGVRHTLQARVCGVPAPKVNWQKDGISCDHNPDYAITHEQGLCTLTIEETMVDDSGTFTCRAWNAAGVTESSCRLTVKDAAAEEELAPPVFTRQLTDGRVREGRTIQLTATVTGNPLPVVTWLHDGACVDASPDYVITYNNGECALRIEEALPQDGGTFVCRAANMLGTDQTSAVVRVELKTPSAAPRFTSPLSNVMARAGQKLRLECVVRGLPHPELTWLHNSRPVRDNQPDAKLTFDGRRATLTIAEAFPKDAGAYTIVAHNAAGQATCSCNVSVKGRLPTETSDSEMASDMEPIKPSIPVQLRETTVVRGQRAQLDCVITGLPEPEVIWYHGDQPVKESKDCQLLFHGDRCTLVINKAEPEDAGTYTVVAINSAGEATSEAALLVTGDGADGPPVKPTFVRLHGSGTVAEGRRHVLEAEFTGTPEPDVTWLKDGKELRSSESLKITRSAGVCRLEMGSVLPLHAGTYMCLASNSAGEARCFSRVEVTPAAANSDQQRPATPVRTGSLRRRLPPSFVQIFVDQQAEQGEEVLFECIINGWPKPAVEWLFDDGPLPDGFSTSSDGQLHLLRVACADDVPCGQVKCVAENDIGKATCAAYLSGTEPSDGTSSSRKSRKSTTKKTTFVETREETEVINGHRQPAHATERERSEEAHSVIAEKPTAQVQRTSYEQRFQSVRGGMESDGVEEDGDRRVQPPRFTAPLQGTVVQEGDRVRLVGEYTGSPDITWYKDGVELKSGGRLVTSHDDGHVTLTIEAAGEEDEGKYTCCLKNAAGTSKSTAELLVRKIVEPPTFEHRLEAQVVQPGQRAVLEVKVAGLPPPQVTWTKDGKPIRDDAEGIEIARLDNHDTLTILSVTHDDAGKYGCSAKNDGGESTSIADFIVTDVMPDVIERRFISHDLSDGEPMMKEIVPVSSESAIETEESNLSPSPSTTKHRSSHKHKKKDKDKDKDGKKKSKSKKSKSFSQESFDSIPGSGDAATPEGPDTADGNESHPKKKRSSTSPKKKSKKPAKEESSEAPQSDIIPDDGDLGPMATVDGVPEAERYAEQAPKPQPDGEEQQPDNAEMEYLVEEPADKGDTVPLPIAEDETQELQERLTPVTSVEASEPKKLDSESAKVEDMDTAPDTSDTAESRKTNHDGAVNPTAEASPDRDAYTEVSVQEEGPGEVDGKSEPTHDVPEDEPVTFTAHLGGEVTQIGHSADEDADAEGTEEEEEVKVAQVIKLPTRPQEVSQADEAGVESTEEEEEIEVTHVIKTTNQPPYEPKIEGKDEEGTEEEEEVQITHVIKAPTQSQEVPQSGEPGVDGTEEGVEESDTVAPSGLSQNEPQIQKRDGESTDEEEQVQVAQASKLPAHSQDEPESEELDEEGKEEEEDVAGDRVTNLPCVPQDKKQTQEISAHTPEGTAVKELQPDDATVESDTAEEPVIREDMSAREEKLPDEEDMLEKPESFTEIDPSAAEPHQKVPAEVPQQMEENEEESPIDGVISPDTSEVETGSGEKPLIIKAPSVEQEEGTFESGEKTPEENRQRSSVETEEAQNEDGMTPGEKYVVKDAEPSGSFVDAEETSEEHKLTPEDHAARQEYLESSTLYQQGTEKDIRSEDAEHEMENSVPTEKHVTFGGEITREISEDDEIPPKQDTGETLVPTATPPGDDSEISWEPPASGEVPASTETSGKPSDNLPPRSDVAVQTPDYLLTAGAPLTTQAQPARDRPHDPVFAAVYRSVEGGVYPTTDSMMPWADAAPAELSIHAPTEPMLYKFARPPATPPKPAPPTAPRSEPAIGARPPPGFPVQSPEAPHQMTGTPPPGVFRVPVVAPYVERMRQASHGVESDTNGVPYTENEAQPPALADRAPILPAPRSSIPAPEPHAPAFVQTPSAVSPSRPATAPKPRAPVSPVATQPVYPPAGPAPSSAPWYDSERPQAAHVPPTMKKPAHLTVSTLTRQINMPPLASHESTQHAAEAAAAPKPPQPANGAPFNTELTEHRSSALESCQFSAPSKPFGFASVKPPVSPSSVGPNVASSVQPTLPSTPEAGKQVVGFAPVQAPSSPAPQYPSSSTQSQQSSASWKIDKISGFASVRAPVSPTPQYTGDAVSTMATSQSLSHSTLRTDRTERLSRSEERYQGSPFVPVPPGVVVTYVARAGPARHHQWTPTLQQQTSAQWTSQTARSATEQREVTRSEPPRRSASSVGEMQRKLEHEVRDQSQDTFRRLARERQTSAPPPPLPPYPVEPARPRQTFRAPTPSKFIPGRPVSSSYLGEHDERIPTRWWPDGYEYIDRRRILVNLPEARGRQRRGRSVTPPSQFDRPAPVRQTPPDRPLPTPLPVSRGRSLVRGSAVAQRSASAPPRRSPAPAAPRVQREAAPARSERDSSWQRREVTSSQRSGWSAGRARSPTPRPVPPPSSYEGSRDDSEVTQSMRQMTSESRFQQGRLPAPRPFPVQQQPELPRSPHTRHSGSRSSETFSRSDVQSQFQQQQHQPSVVERAPVQVFKPQQPTGIARTSLSQRGVNQQNFVDKQHTHESLDRPGVRGFHDTSAMESRQYNRQQTGGSSTVEMRIEKTFEERMEKTEFTGVSGRVGAPPRPSQLALAPSTPQPIVTSPVPDRASPAPSFQRAWQQRSSCSSSTLGRDSPCGYASDTAGYVSEPELALLAAPPPSSSGRQSQTTSRDYTSSLDRRMTSRTPPAASSRGWAASDTESDHESRLGTKWTPEGPTGATVGGSSGQQWSESMSRARESSSQSGGTTTVTKQEFHSQKMMREETTTRVLPPGAVGMAPLQSPLPTRAIQPRPALLLRAAPPATQTLDRGCNRPVVPRDSDWADDEATSLSDAKPETGCTPDGEEAVVSFPTSPSASCTADPAPEVSTSGGPLPRLARWLVRQAAGLTRRS